MPIHVTCAECGAKYRLDEQRAGSVLPCKRCGAAMEVPGARQMPARSEGRSGGRSGTRSGKRRQSGGSPWLLWGGIAAAALVLVIVVALVVGGNESSDDLANAADPASGGTDTLDGSTIAAPAPAAPPVSTAPTTPAASTTSPTPAGLPVQGDPSPGSQPGSQPMPGGETPAAPVPLPVPSPPPADPAAVAWQVVADPPIEPVTFPAVLSWQIVWPSSLVRPEDIIFPKGRTTFVAYAPRARQEGVTRHVVDLRTGEAVAEIDPPQSRPGSIFQLELSPDGWYQVFLNALGGPAVWDDDQKMRRSLKTGRKSTRYAWFVGLDHLLTVGNQLERMGELWHLPTGEQIANVPLPEAWDARSVTASPGGRYIAVFARTAQVLWFYDVTTAQWAGALPLPEGVARPEKAECTGVAFSDEGDAVAAMLWTGDGSTLVVWDLASQAPTDVYRIPKKVRREWAYNWREPIQWLPGGKRLLIGHQAIYDRDRSGIVHWFPDNMDQAHGRKVLDARRFVEPGQSRPGELSLRALNVVTLDESQFTAPEPPRP